MGQLEGVIDQMGYSALWSAQHFLSSSVINLPENMFYLMIPYPNETWRWNMQNACMHAAKIFFIYNLWKIQTYSKLVFWMFFAEAAKFVQDDKVK